MATFLHDLSTLESLADGPEGPVRDWANTRLALRDRDRVRHLPDHPMDAARVIASGASRALMGVHRQLREGSPFAARNLEVMSAMGLLPLDDPGRWIATLRERWREGDEYLQMVTSEVLADLGAFDDELVVALTKAKDTRTIASASALMLRWALAQGQSIEPLVPGIAAGLAALLRQEPEALFDALCRLGLPFLSEGISLDDAVEIGARLAGQPPPELPPARGSPRSRARKRVHQLLEGRAGAAEALLLALADLDLPEHAADLVTLAAWLAQPKDADPVRAVLQGAGEDRALLARARAAFTLDHAELLLERESSLPLSGDPALALVPALAALDPERARSEALQDEVELRLFFIEDERANIILPFTSDPETLPDELRQGEPIALARAAYVHTEEVLAALLAFETDDPGTLDALTMALAEQADPAAYERLQQLAEGPAAAMAFESALKRGALLLGRAS